MGLEQKLVDDMKSAMKSGDKILLWTIRMLRAQLKNASIAKGKDLSDEDIIEVLSREAKKRKESLELYKKAAALILHKRKKKNWQLLLPIFLSSFRRMRWRRLLMKSLLKQELKACEILEKLWALSCKRLKVEQTGR